MKQNKIDVITIKGMQQLFSVSRSTVYKKYIPKLEPIPTRNNKVLFDYQAAKKVHDELNKEMEQFNVIA